MTTLDAIVLPPLFIVVLCFHLGYAFSRLALPQEFVPYRLLLMPLVGCALLLNGVAIVTTSSALSPPVVGVLLAVLVLPLNVWLLVRRLQWGGAQVLPVQDVLAVGVCWLLALLVFVLAVLPVFHWGFSAPIGSNWDAAEFYVPLGRALQLRSQRDIPTLPDNPLVTILSTAPVSGRIHAFSYVHALASSATGIDPLRSYAPVMALVLALQPFAVYPFARTVGLGRVAALLATALAALAWLPLWVAYNSFSNHLMSLPLLPIALASGVLVLRGRGWATLGTGALFVAALATAYYPALTAYGALFGPVGMYVVWRTSERGALLGRGVVLVVASMVLSFPAQVAFFLHDGFLGEIARASSGFQIARFVQLQDALGFAATFHGESLPGDARFVVLAIGLALVLGVVAFAARGVPLLAAMSLGVAGYQGYTAMTAYHYGFYKGVTFEIPLFTMLIAAGAALVWGYAARWRYVGVVVRGVLVLGMGLMLVLNGGTVWGIQRHYADAGPQLWSADELDVLKIRDLVPPAASVLVVPSDGHPPTFNSLLSYALLGHRLVGQFKTGYNALDRVPGEQVADYALLPRGGDPTGYGYESRSIVWKGADLQLYGRDLDVRVHRVFGSGGRYATVAPSETLVLRVGPQQIALPGEPMPTSGAQDGVRVALAVASFDPAVIAVTVAGGAARRVAFPGGIYEVASDVLALPSEVTIHNLGHAAVYLWWGEVRAAASAVGSTPHDDVFVQVIPDDQVTGPQVAADMRLFTQVLPDGVQKLTGLVTIARAAENGDTWQEVGQWVFFPSGRYHFRFNADLERSTFALLQDGQVADLYGSAQPPQDGDYQATLLLANDAQIVYGATLWTWRWHAGRVAQIASDSVVFDVVPLPKPATVYQVDSRDGSLRLRGYTLPQRDVRAGETIALDLIWQSLQKVRGDLRARVSLQDVAGHRWVEQVVPLGHTEHGTSRWQEGEVSDQVFALRLPDDVPPGVLTLTVDVVGQEDRPLPMVGSNGPLSLGTITIVR